MRKSALVMAAWLAFAATACVRTATNEATGEVDLDIESPTQRGEDWEGRLRGQGAWASLTGTTRAFYAEGRTEMTIAVEGAPAGASFTWAVREGRCGERGMVVLSSTTSTTLNVDSQGRAGATGQFMARLDEAKDYVVELYASSVDPATGRPTVVACGDLDD